NTKTFQSGIHTITIGDGANIINGYDTTLTYVDLSYETSGGGGRGTDGNFSSSYFPKSSPSLTSSTYTGTRCWVTQYVTGYPPTVALNGTNPYNNSNDNVRGWLTGTSPYRYNGTTKQPEIDEMDYFPGYGYRFF
ncbi:MAG: hypothetical protein EBT93_12025, partial [Alphaproteobacteria bacterium]|nr:hypothetical protein [Alphaproteobacteria bacterium]